MSDSAESRMLPIKMLTRAVLVSLFSALVVALALLAFLNRGLPAEPAPGFDFPAAGFKFVVGSGHPEQDLMQVNSFVDGFALLSSGPANLQATQLPLLQYTWQPVGQPEEISFFWRQHGNMQKVNKVEIVLQGTVLLDLSVEPAWQGDIAEFGFLISGETGKSVYIGEAVFNADTMKSRLSMLWQSWTGYELRSQQSINFLQGGGHNQSITLPVVLIIWLFLTALLIRFLPRKLLRARSSRDGFVMFCLFFLAAWMLLDMRWSFNSFTQAKELLGTFMEFSPEQRSTNDLDGAIYTYMQRIKQDIIKPKESGEPNRILIIGDENSIDYYLLRAKYHLLPNSAHVSGSLNENLSPQSIDYVIFFGQPSGILQVPGWNPTWHKALIEVDYSEWGVVYRIRP